MLFLKWILTLLVGLATPDEPKTPDALSAPPTQASARAPLGPGAVDEAAWRRLLEQHDALPAGPAKDALARAVDAAAGQRYATWSRLYWHRDLEEAKARARETGRPILSLHLLGRLDEELSCANSRFYRVALYANRDLARFLTENFVLHWESVRPVPRVRIDFGDGRVIETTLAGNSAHYVLDMDGRPIDVLPGLYAPVAFARALSEVLPIARVSPRLGDGERVHALREHFARSEAAALALFDAGALSAAELPPGAGPALATAERLAPSKLRLEGPLVEALGGPALSPEAPIWLRRVEDARLDDHSRALVAHLAPLDWTAARAPLPERGVDALIRSFEAALAIDTRTNELTLRPRARALFFRGNELADLAAIDAAVYADVFKTPRADPWLGLANPLAFSALPADGLAR